MGPVYGNAELQTTLTVNCIPLICKIKLFGPINKILQITLMSVFIPKLQVPEKKELVFVDPVCKVQFVHHRTHITSPLLNGQPYKIYKSNLWAEFRVVLCKIL
jgi:hypothetical protein